MTLLMETDRSLPLVQLGISAYSGAVLDPQGKEGLTRLMTRLMRRTGDGLGPEVLDERFDTLGSAMSSDVSITSSGFSGSVISASLNAFVKLAQGVLCRPSFDSSELERLQRETIDEIRELKDSDRSLARMWYRTAFFGAHPYGRSVLGTEQTLSAISPDDIRAHYARTIVRDNLLLAVAGDADELRVKELEAALFDALPAGPKPESQVPAPVSLPGRRLLVVDKPERTQTQIVIGTMGSHPSDPDHTALVVGNTIFGGTFTARLMQEVRAKRGWSYGASSSVPFDRQRQSFSMWTFPQASDAAACVRLQLDLLRTWVNEGVSAEELSWAKRYLIRSNVFNLDTAAKRMSLLVDERIYDLPANYYAEYPARVEAVTLDEVNAAIRKRISLEDVLITVVGTEANIGNDLRGAVDGLSEYRVVPFDADPVSPW
ncbi:MAG TPA: pitrilysin family protein [Polyangiaceae bacterium]|jgi:zinc protease|nr:pitrilysin family protein [Polyangiaceae bacterium]